MMTTCESDHKRPAGVYEIRIAGHLDSERAGWFGEFTITQEARGESVLRGPLVDQAALFGVLKKIHNLGLTLVAVQRVAPTPGDKE